jgi:hypothetical protein
MCGTGTGSKSRRRGSLRQSVKEIILNIEISNDHFGKIAV